MEKTVTLLYKKLGTFGFSICLSLSAAAHPDHDHHQEDNDGDDDAVVVSPVVDTEYKSHVIRERDSETFRESPDLNKMTILWSNDYRLGAMSAAVETLGAGKTIPLHIHKNAEEMIYILQGEGLETLGASVNPVHAGDLVLVTPGTVHGLQNTGRQPIKFFFTYNTNEMMGFFRDYRFKNREDVEARFNFDFMRDLLIKHSYHFAVPDQPLPTVQIPLKPKN
jgi:quercetin dioxygenase-like cupin family protein